MVILTNTNIINNCDEILTVKEVSQYLKVNVHKVYELINDGLLPAFKLGSLKVSRKSLEEFVKSCENDFSIWWIIYVNHV